MWRRRRFTGCSVKETRQFGGLEIRIARFRILTNFTLGLTTTSGRVLVEKPSALTSIESGRRLSSA